MSNEAKTNIRTYPGEVFINRLYCEECGVEMVRDDHMVLTSDPIQFCYTCPKCGKTTTSIGRYPEVYFTDKAEAGNVKRD